MCYGFLRRVGERTTICQAVAGPDGSQVLAYDKMHLCDMGACSEAALGVVRGDAAPTAGSGTTRSATWRGRESYKT